VPVWRKRLPTLSRLGLCGEVFVVDNGFIDGSQTIAEQCGGRVVHESRRGYGSALMRGAEEAAGAVHHHGGCRRFYDLTDLERLHRANCVTVPTW